MSQDFLLFRSPFLLGLCWLLSASALLAEEEASPWRRYAEGALTAADFQGTTPDPLPLEDGVRLHAKTYYELQYHYRYQYYTEKRPAKTTVALSELDIYAGVNTKQSWIKDRKDLPLIDHEQGHFDIAEIFARSACQTLEERLSEEPLTAEGKTLEAALKELEAKLHKQLEPFFAASSKAQYQYDQETAHGLIPDKQQAHRAQQKKKLQALKPTKVLKFEVKLPGR